MANDRHRRLGRKTNPRKTDESRPGTIFLLAILSAIPIVVLFIAGPIARPGVPTLVAFPVWRWIFLVGTPLLAGAAVLVHRRAPEFVRAHNAAGAGRILAYMVLALWALQALLYALFLRDLAAAG